VYDLATATWILPDGSRVTEAELRASARDPRNVRVGTLVCLDTPLDGWHPARVCSGRERLGE
jgi:hypothetical protein